jgi:hypothetical protein
MNRLKFLAATALSAAMLLPGAVQAMTIQQFDKMADPDQSEYIAELVQGAEKVLRDDGKPDLAAQISYLFTTNPPDGNISIGMSDFMLTLAKARLADAQRAEKDPKAKRLEVEDAMAVMLKNVHGIDLPQTFFTVNKDFKPKLPPQKK